MLYVGRLVAEKGVEVLLDAWPLVRADATLVLVGDGPLAARGGRDAGRAAARALSRVRSFRSPTPPPSWRSSAVDPDAAVPRAVGARLQRGDAPGTAGDRHDSVGAVAGGLVRDGETGLVVAPGDAGALALAVERLLADASCARAWDAAARQAVAATPTTRWRAFDRALRVARPRSAR